MNIITKLFKAVQNHADLEKETFLDCASYGADGGVSGFIYYSDTLAFFDANKELIIDLAKEQAEELGVDPLEMIANFVCLRSLDLSSFDVAEALYSDDHEDETQIKNALAWYALEEVSRAVEYGQFDEYFDEYAA